MGCSSVGFRLGLLVVACGGDGLPGLRDRCNSVWIRRVFCVVPAAGRSCVAESDPVSAGMLPMSRVPSPGRGGHDGLHLIDKAYSPDAPL
jgi:hypothetical protein